MSRGNHLGVKRSRRDGGGGSPGIPSTTMVAQWRSSPWVARTSGRGSHRDAWSQGRARGWGAGAGLWPEAAGDDAPPAEEEGGGGVLVIRALHMANGGWRMGHPSVVMQGARDGDRCSEWLGAVLRDWASRAGELGGSSKRGVEWRGESAFGLGVAGCRG
jgi:hypothetical protein